ncbi:MAG: hypothetical protein K0V04_29975 [Deltaproteobacteria bacterium]|nr:hypothetical protein [Deltaproteobacteria bacterium]
MNQRTRPLSLILAAGMAMMSACDHGHPNTEQPRGAVVVTTASDAATATAASGLLVIDVSDEDAVYEFQLGSEPSVWRDVFVDDGATRTPLLDVIATAQDATELDVWTAGYFQWTVDADNLPTLTDTQVAQLERDGTLSFGVDSRYRTGGDPIMECALYDCGDGIWIICTRPEV